MGTRSLNFVKMFCIFVFWILVDELSNLEDHSVHRVSLLDATSAVNTGWIPLDQFTYPKNEFEKLVMNASSSPESFFWNNDTQLFLHLPAWVKRYVCWHHYIRKRFPGRLLFDLRAGAPPVIIRVCGPACGGLHDRLGQLPMDLYLANQTSRVLLIKWGDRPMDLETFLLPNILDWTVPRGINGLQGGSNAYAHFPKLLADNRVWASGQTLDLAIQNISSELQQSPKVVIHSIFAHQEENDLGRFLRRCGETDMIHDTASFGGIWHAFFRPTALLRVTLRSILLEELGGTRRYSVIHCRVRHPKNFPQNMPTLKGKGKNSPDFSGLPWEGKYKDTAINVTMRALQCAANLEETKNHKFYIISDSGDLVNHVINKNTTFEGIKITDGRASLSVVSRPIEGETVHIDRQKHFTMEEYMSVFVDLYIAILARCVIFSVGNFAYFAIKISGTKCTLKLGVEEWGGSSNSYGGRECL